MIIFMLPRSRNNAIRARAFLSFVGRMVAGYWDVRYSAGRKF